MNRKEEIVLATLDLASEIGLDKVSLSMISDKVGIRKASLFNHFSNKEEIINEMYLFIRENAKKQVLDDYSIDYQQDAKTILINGINKYKKMIQNPKLLRFYRIIYSQRSYSKEAGAIMSEETSRMIKYNKYILNELCLHHKLKIDNLDYSAISFSLTIHGLIEDELDNKMINSSSSYSIDKYIDYFCTIFKGEKQ